MPISYANAAVVGSTVYLVAYSGPATGDRRALLAYDVAADRWHSVAEPDPGGYAIATVGGTVVAYAATDERGELPDWIRDAETGRWERLPDDPLPRSSGRTMLWDGSELILLALPAYEDVPPDEPSLVRAATLDLGKRTWRRLPDSAQLGFPIAAADGLLVNPDLGGADGGEVNGWGRRYPNGGSLDAHAGRWLPLPGPPAQGSFVPSAGVLWSDGAAYMSDHGWALDLERSTWVWVPAYDEGFHTDQTVVAAGRDLVVFGGAGWASASAMRGELLDSARLWEPPAPADG
ncbi:MAG: hypothetical protein R3C15_20300 [Thermoleophilia bacterium]